MRRGLLASLAAIAVLAAGCGGDGDADAGPLASLPVASAPFPDRLREFNRVLERNECEPAARFTFSVLRATGRVEGPVTEEECRFLSTDKSFLQLLSDVEFDPSRSREFGTAALAEAPPPPGEDFEAIVAVFAIDVDGEYRFVGLTAGDRQIGRSLPKGNDALEVAVDFVNSVSGPGCDPDLLNPEGNLGGAGDPEKICRELDEGENFAPALKATEEAPLEPMGETLDWSFWGVPTEAGYFTLMINSLPSEGKGQSLEYGVYDVLPAGEVEKSGKG